MENLLRKPAILLLAAICAASFTLGGCGSKEAPTGEPSSSQAAQEAAEAAEQPEEPEGDQAEPEGDQAEPDPEDSDEGGEAVTLGALAGEVYTNESLGVSMQVPAGWYALDDEQRVAVVQAGSQMVAAGDETKQAMLDLSMERYLLLVSAYETNPLEAAAGNANIQLAAEKISILASAFVKNADDYLTASKAQLDTVTNIEGIEIQYVFGDTQDAVIGGKTFRMLPVEIQQANGAALAQMDYYVYFDGEYAFSIVASYLTEEQNAAIKTSLDTLTIV